MPVSVTGVKEGTFLTVSVVVSGGKAAVEGSTVDIFDMLADKSNFPVTFCILL